MTYADVVPKKIKIMNKHRCPNCRRFGHLNVDCASLMLNCILRVELISPCSFDVKLGDKNLITHRLHYNTYSSIIT